ncbi:hypothetical protein J5N97_027560 [Dioscorea zingiberensis]|uniref:hAT-like transposase RNase-H fold domain-containing protein n=1 Tax=Dioscorea zingiberensis TaxID=325984 RepID=A0A9D5H7W7_9LILI|nr:hypothetical protein J5N97_027560 [Dioscorea zingiberensis]
MTLLMRGKFDKYWGDCNILMAISAVLDPRYKMRLINFCFHRIYSYSESERNILEVKQTLWEIYEMYANAIEQPPFLLLMIHIMELEIFQ